MSLVEINGSVRYKNSEAYSTSTGILETPSINFYIHQLIQHANEVPHAIMMIFLTVFRKFKFSFKPLSRIRLKSPDILPRSVSIIA